MHEAIVELAERLKATLPPCLDAVFVVNSGGEANDQVTRAPATVQARRVTEALHERGILLGTTGPARNVVKIRPPLVFQREQADLLLQNLEEVLASGRSAPG